MKEEGKLKQFDWVKISGRVTLVGDLIGFIKEITIVDGKPIYFVKTYTNGDPIFEDDGTFLTKIDPNTYEGD